MREKTEQFLQTCNLQDTDDVEVLLELAALVRELLAAGHTAEIECIVRRAAANGCDEAFAWCMELLQEEMEKPDCRLQPFVCDIGRAIPDYDGFVERLQVDRHTVENSIEKQYGAGGEVTAFFNILKYETGYKNIRFASFENFDAKDNDYVQYKLLFEPG